MSFKRSHIKSMVCMFFTEATGTTEAYMSKPVVFNFFFSASVFQITKNELRQLRHKERTLYFLCDSLQHKTNRQYITPWSFFIVFFLSVISGNCPASFSSTDSRACDPGASGQTIPHTDTPHTSPALPDTWYTWSICPQSSCHNMHIVSLPSSQRQCQQNKCCGDDDSAFPCTVFWK